MSTYYEDIRGVKDLDLPWKTLAETNILIVGATGLIGRALVDVLMQLPHRNFHLYAGARDLVYAQNCFAEYKDEAAFTILSYDVVMPMPFDMDFIISSMRRVMLLLAHLRMIRWGLSRRILGESIICFLMEYNIICGSFCMSLPVKFTEKGMVLLSVKRIVVLLTGFL